LSARVFISCGQREGEREVASRVAAWFSAEGFRPYVALQAQSIQDINSGIMRELRRADYYVFIDFRREKVGVQNETGVFRGSLFSHQELAIAYVLGFDSAIFFREDGVLLEGFGAFLMTNATLFHDPATLPDLVAEAVRRRRWSPRYSRNLVLGSLWWSEQPIQYGPLTGRFLYVAVQNRRSDVAAPGVVARLASFQLEGDAVLRSPNRSPLKVTGQSTVYQQTIWPDDEGAFDLLCVDRKNGARVYLNNALDVAPTPILFERPGTHILHYEVLAPGFERVPFKVRLRLTASCADATAKVVGDDGAAA
jgi:hypothetical protein